MLQSHQPRNIELVYHHLVTYHRLVSICPVQLIPVTVTRITRVFIAMNWRIIEILRLHPLMAKVTLEWIDSRVITRSASMLNSRLTRKMVLYFTASKRSTVAVILFLSLLLMGMFSNYEFFNMMGDYQLLTNSILCTQVHSVQIQFGKRTSYFNIERKGIDENFPQNIRKKVS